MEYQLALSKDLHITAEEFADAWNETSTDPDKGEVILMGTPGAKFLDPTLAAALLSIPATVASSAIYELIKDTIHRLQEKKGHPETPHKHIHVEQTKKPDGTQIFVIDIDES
jgi:predicted aconitase